MMTMGILPTVPRQRRRRVRRNRHHLLHHHGRSNTAVFPVPATLPLKIDIKMVSHKVKEKRKDFVKQKLKVGKTKPKATAHTELGFKAKAIGLPSQSITKVHLPKDVFAHYLSLTRHHSPIARREALAYLNSHLPAPTDIDASLFSALAPLILDPAPSVRSTLLTFFSSIPQASMAPHMQIIVMCIRSGLTHLQEDVRRDAAKFLSLLLKVEDRDVSQQIISRNWTSLLTCFGGIFNWDMSSLNEKTNSTTPNPNTRKFTHAAPLSSLKNSTGHITALSQFLKLGLSSQCSGDSSTLHTVSFYHTDTAKHMMPTNSAAAYSRLNLFSIPKAAAAEDICTRFEKIKPIYSQIIVTLDSGRREGGEVGRPCKHLLDFLEGVKKNIETSSTG
ncbi:Rix1 complex component [Limtongia smithiae]|uniref:Rix1 complex component n=1 Tax=Limtongia smithiae TaxID=1125753 RepID=UPI0034CE50DC